MFGIAECARAREFFRLLNVQASSPSQRDQALCDMGRIMTIGTKEAHLSMVGESLAEHGLTRRTYGRFGEVCGGASHQ
jgi:hypothetical protein